ncbi:unnamed protein product, partial [Discosporangium mesarthrocarpum]
KPPRAQNRRFITKFMFRAAAARPNKICNGPIGGIALAKRDSKNCKKGTLIMNIAKDNGERDKNLVIKVIPAIKARMPRPPGHTMFAQHNGAKLHMEHHTEKKQPTNSPDLNVNDLGFSHSIQQPKEDVGVTSGKELVEATTEALSNKSGRAFLQSVVAVMGCKGDNGNKMPHLGK